MPKRYTSEGRCKSKIPYTSRAEARTILRRGRFKSNASGGLKVYTCNQCGFYHIGGGGNPGGKRALERNQVFGYGRRKKK